MTLVTWRVRLTAPIVTHTKLVVGYDWGCAVPDVLLEQKHPTVIFDMNAKPVGVPFRDHLRTFRNYLQRIRNLVWEQTVFLPDVLAAHPALLHVVEFQRGYRSLHA